MRSLETLREASGYQADAHKFDDVMRILDPELRIVTPTDPDGDVSNSSATYKPDAQARQEVMPERTMPLAGAAGLCFDEVRPGVRHSSK